MKKVVTALVILVIACSVLSTPAVAAAKGRGGVMVFIAGCCFGVRAGADYNYGKEIHWREWSAYPVCGPRVRHLGRLDGANGVTRAQYAAKYGATFY